MAWSGNEASYMAFVDRHSLTFPTIDDTAGVIYAKYGVPSQPAWVFIARDGTARTMRGLLEPSALQKALAALSSD